MRSLESDDSAVVAIHAEISKPKPNPKPLPLAVGGVRGDSIVINKKTGVFWWTQSILLDDNPSSRPGIPDFYEAASGKCQKD